MNKFTVIVPVYNVEEYLQECLESIINQDYNDIEIILVEDGSTDRSKEICDIYANKDCRIKVVYKSNSGLSAARNTGLDVCSGKYIMFLDSDDYLENKKVISNFVKIFEENNCDLIYGAYTGFNDIKHDMRINKKNINISNEDIENLDTEEAILKIFDSKSYQCTAYTKIYKRSLIESNKLRFKEGIYHEDEEWTPRVLIKSSKIYIYKEPFYMRRYRPDSIMTSRDDLKIQNRIRDMLWIAKYMVSYIEKECKKKKLVIKLNQYFGSFLLSSIKLYDVIDSKEIRYAVKKNIKDNYKLIDYTKRSKYHIVLNIYRILGIELTSKILRKI